jgi:DNA-binding NtrC family response regulator
MSHALIVEDNADEADLLATLAAGAGFSTAIAPTLKDARRQLALRSADIILLDLQLPDGSGLEVAEEAAALPDTEVVLITGHASLETSIQALRLGVADYLVKPVNDSQLLGVLSRVTRPAALQEELADLHKTLQRDGRFGRLWGRSPAMCRIYEHIGRVAGTSVTVLVTGESGTGKELVAQTIHDLSRRRRQPFLAINCGAISAQLIESELFGHEKGSFTGASRQHVGYFESASGGTLFLDEITEMPHDMQVKLLRVLETGAFMRVGGTEILQADVRIVAASNRSPQQAVADGRLRDDLYYRLNVFGIELPPLRERIEDVGLLAEHFLDEINRAEATAKRFGAEALERLRQYHWPGNVRELRNAVQRAYVLAEGETVGVDGLPSERPRDEAVDGTALTVRIGTTLAEVERRLILATLAKMDGHRDRTAEALGISTKTLYNRLKEYGREEERGEPPP